MNLRFEGKKKKVFVKNDCKSNFENQFDTDYSIEKDVSYDVLFVSMNVPDNVFEFCGIKYTEPLLSRGNKEFIFYRTYECNPKDESDVDSIWSEDEITCPVCGSKQSDSWESSDESDDEYCYDCGCTYGFTRNIEVSYRSQLIKYPKFEKFEPTKMKGEDDD